MNCAVLMGGDGIARSRDIQVEPDSLSASLDGRPRAARILQRAQHAQLTTNFASSRKWRLLTLHDVKDPRTCVEGAGRTSGKYPPQGINDHKS